MLHTAAIRKQQELRPPTISPANHPTPASAIHLCFGDGTVDVRATLSGGEVGGVALDRGGRALLHFLGALGEDELDVAGVGHVRVNLGRLC